MKSDSFVSINRPIYFTTCEIALAAGFSTFMPKYVSNQFGQKASAAGILTGEFCKVIVGC